MSRASLAPGSLGSGAGGRRRRHERASAAAALTDGRAGRRRPAAQHEGEHEHGQSAGERDAP